MDAYPLLARIARLLERHNLEVVLIGNAAAALQGAPVTTVDFDFLFRRTPANVRKLSAIARELQAVLSSRARKQPAVHAIWPCYLSWRKCLKKSLVSRKARLEVLKKESDLAERDLIRRLLALPPEKRTHFLRKRVGIRMSCL